MRDKTGAHRSILSTENGREREREREREKREGYKATLFTGLFPNLSSF